MLGLLACTEKSKMFFGGVAHPEQIHILSQRGLS